MYATRNPAKLNKLPLSQALTITIFVTPAKILNKFTNALLVLLHKN